jgi:hypothetical protein
VTDEAEDPTDPEGTEPVVEESLGGWGATSAESSAPSDPNPYAAIPASDAPAPAGPAKRPTSLRSALDEPSRRPPRGSATPPPAPFEAAAAPRETPAAAVEPTGPTASPLDPVFERLATAQDRAVAFASERPEAVVGVAFVGGLILATILKRLGRR